MMFALKYALQRSWRVRSQFALMAFFLSLGFCGWLMSETSQNSIRQKLAASARQILSADITVSVRRELKDEELKILVEETKGKGILIKGYELFAMMTTDQESRLVLVRAVEDQYPLYGFMKLDLNSSVPALKGNKLWAYSEFKTLFDLKTGDKVTLGDSHFDVTDFVTEDQTQTFRLASLAPRVFIHMDDLKKTGLVQFGSTFTSTHFFKASNEADVPKITENLKKRLSDPAIDISSYLSLPDDESSPTQRLADFLGLTSLVALLFSALSLFYLLQVWSLEQQKERALLSSFGLSRGSLYLVEVLQSFFIALLSTLFSTILMLVTAPLIEQYLKKWTKEEFQLNLGIQEVTLILVSQFILLIVLSNPFSTSKNASLAQLIKNKFSPEQSQVWKFLPLLFLLWPYSILASRSIRNGSYFFLGLLFISVSLVLLGRGLINLLARIPYSSWKLSLAVKSLRRQSTASWAFIFTVGLSSSLLNLIPQIQSSIEGMMTMDEVKKRPSLFLFDIQNEQWPEVQQLFNEINLVPTATSPLIRGRIIKINEESFERKDSDIAFRTREEEEEIRSRNRGINVTYRPNLQQGEKIVEGDEFPMTYDSKQKHAYISLEKRYAGRIGAEVGDVITFDIQGIELTAEVKNLRQVQWSRFEPNFFILFQDGLLNDAPQTFLTSLPYLEPKTRVATMKQISNRFSNVSIIDVERLMSVVIQNLERVSGALKLMTYLTLLTGLMTIVFLLNAESRRRAYEVHLLKVLGAQPQPVLESRLTEVVLVSAISLLVGVGTSFIIATIIVDRVFQVPVVLDSRPGLAIIALVLGLAWIVSSWTTRRVYKENSFAFLKKEE